MRLYRPKHSELTPEAKMKANARSYLNSYVLRGKIERGPCVVKPCRRRSQGHHKDYSKPLDVVWICFKHHRELHRQEMKAA